ncbi:MAG: DUF5038 domain-containing protein [Hespellia sp.]|nr:DUF5038 domain-containing protein [Hespellia sp.]
MKKPRFILAVILFAALLFFGIILPILFKKDSKPKASETPSTTQVVTTQEADAPEVTYQTFDALDDFLAQNQITALKEQFPLYLQTKRLSTPQTVTFLSDETVYPSAEETEFFFSMTNGEKVPVYYDHFGHFLFGKEKLLLSDATITYEKETLDDPSALTTKEIEQMQEGGYMDTTPEPSMTVTDSTAAVDRSKEVK